MILRHAIELSNIKKIYDSGPFPLQKFTKTNNFSSVKKSFENYLKNSRFYA